MQDEPGALLARDLETHLFPRAVPVKGMAGASKGSSSYAPGSGEGQDKRDRFPMRRGLVGSGATVQSKAQVARNSAECLDRGRGHTHDGDFIGTTPAQSIAAPVRRRAWSPPPIKQPGTCSCRTLSLGGACSRQPDRACGPGWRGPWPFRVSSPGAFCTRGLRDWLGETERPLPRRPT